MLQRRFSYCIFLLPLLVIGLSCADNKLDVMPSDQSFPLQLVLDADEGADLPDAEDYDLEIKFADHVLALPSHPIVVDYTLTDIEGDMAGEVAIDKIVYEYEDDDCVYEREIPFTREGDGTNGTITIPVDADLGTVPESFEVVFKLPGSEETEGGFVFELSGLQGGDQVIIGSPLKFNYSVLDSDIAGEWALEIADEQQFNDFKSIFGPLSSELEQINFTDITGKIIAEFEYGEMKFVVELTEEQEVVTCEDGEIEMEVDNIEIEIESEYEAEDGELAFEGSHFILGDDGEINNELDFEIESTYEIADGVLKIKFIKVIDEDHFQDGDELFSDDDGMVFNFEKE